MKFHRVDVLDTESVPVYSVAWDVVASHLPFDGYSNLSKLDLIKLFRDVCKAASADGKTCPTLMESKNFVEWVAQERHSYFSLSSYQYVRSV